MLLTVWKTSEQKGDNMSKSMIGAFAQAQILALSAKDNKERLRFTIAGCKDGKLYDHSGTDYGVYDPEAPDAIFIPDTDLQLSRITGVKLEGIARKMTEFFSDVEPAVEEPTDTDGDRGDAIVDSEPVDEIDVEAVEDACKKAIKKGKFDKAQKLIDKLGGHKKLQKKLEKAQ